jgi:hypothetical protein
MIALSAAGPAGKLALNTSPVRSAVAPEFPVCKGTHEGAAWHDTAEKGCVATIMIVNYRSCCCDVSAAQMANVHLGSRIVANSSLGNLNSTLFERVSLIWLAHTRENFVWTAYHGWLVQLALETRTIVHGWPTRETTRAWRHAAK